MRAAIALLGLAGAAALPWGATGTASAASVRTVRLQDIAIHPKVLRIARGTVVKWRFLDPVAAHNVTSRGQRRFKSSPTKREGTYRVRFRKRGTYRYVCTIHPGMRGRIEVR